MHFINVNYASSPVLGITQSMAIIFSIFMYLFYKCMVWLPRLGTSAFSVSSSDVLCNLSSSSEDSEKQYITLKSIELIMMKAKAVYKAKHII